MKQKLENALNVIQLEKGKRQKKAETSESQKPDRESIERGIAELATLSELDYQTARKKQSKDLGLTLDALDRLVAKQRRDQGPHDAREFVLLDDGLYRVDDYGEPFDRITSSIKILGQCRHMTGRGYRLVIEVIAPGGEVNRLLLERASFAGDGKEAIRQVLDAGLRFTQTDGAQRMLLRYLVSVENEKSIILTDKPGWHGESVYVTPSGNIPPENDEVIYSGPENLDLDFEQSGTLQEWQEHVAAYMVGNPYVQMFICSAFAAIIMPMVGLSTFLLNLVGDSSSGKTTGLYGGCSVFGSPRRMKTWRTTANALEGLAAGCNHALLALDEMSMAPPSTVSQVSYSVGNQQGKSRATRNGDTRPSQKWQTCAVSTSEKTLCEILRSAGEEPNAGQEVRTIDIIISGDTPHGAYHNLHDIESGAALSAHLFSATRQYYGTAAPAFIQRIQQEGFAAVAKESAEIMQAFRDRYLPASVNGQVTRVFDRFALLAAVGELSARWGITGWPEGQPMESMGFLSEDWLTNRGGVGAREEQKIIAQVTYFFEKYGHSRFESFGLDNKNYIPSQRAGFYKIDSDGNTHHYVLTETFNQEICKGFNIQRVKTVLHGVGLLVTEKNDPVKDPQKKSTRAYHFVNVITGGTGDVVDGGYL